MNNLSSNQRRTLLYFNPPFPDEVNITSATITLQARGSWSGSRDLTAKRIVEKWKEKRANWNNATGGSFASNSNQAVTTVGSKDDGDEG